MAIRAFISYSHKDAELLTQLHEHLSALQRQRLLDTWTDREIHPGGVIDINVEEQLEQAELYLLLVSSAFIQSTYCFEKEFSRACERQRAGKAIIVPIIIRECDWKIPELRQFKALPEDGQPVISRHWHTPDEAFANITAGLRTLIERGPFSKQGRLETDTSTKKTFVPDEQQATEDQHADQRKVATDIVDRSNNCYVCDTSLDYADQRFCGECDYIAFHARCAVKRNHGGLGIMDAIFGEVLCCPKCNRPVPEPDTFIGPTE